MENVRTGHLKRSELRLGEAYRRKGSRIRWVDTFKRTISIDQWESSPFEVAKGRHLLIANALQWSYELITCNVTTCRLAHRGGRVYTVGLHRVSVQCSPHPNKLATFCKLVHQYQHHI